jgi:DNA-binding response OmpR family regulator
MATDQHTVLVVDDEPKIRDIARRYLEADGFTVTECADGPGALAAARDQRPDLIVLDVMLPDINGKEVCHRVRADSTLEDVRILCISGMIEEDKVQELRLSGADDFLHKPFDIEELIDRMCGLLEIEPATTPA